MVPFLAAPHPVAAEYKDMAKELSRKVMTIFGLAHLEYGPIIFIRYVEYFRNDILFQIVGLFVDRC